MSAPRRYACGWLFIITYVALEVTAQGAGLLDVPHSFLWLPWDKGQCTRSVIDVPAPTSTQASTQSAGLVCRDIPTWASPQPVPYDPTIRSTVNNGSTSHQKAFADQCVLWDPTCTGNTSLALDIFLNKTSYVIANNPSYPAPPYCLKDPIDQGTFEKIVDWMRSPQCTSSEKSWDASHSKTRLSIYDGLAPCCGYCYLTGSDADIFYWPQPGSDDSCLNVVGTTATPLGDGGTSTTISFNCTGIWSQTAWACTPKTPTHGQSVIITAAITSTGDLTWKYPVVDPWSVTDCVSGYAQNYSTPTANSVGQRRNGSAPSITQPPQARASTLVLDGTTFVSPSIYARFRGIQAQDLCGTSRVDETLLSFRPDELSTIVGPFKGGSGPVSSRVFNFADLPCPPQSIAEENWYKPAPGEPYRPLIAFPNQLKNLNPLFAACTQGLFRAVDPPIALQPQAFLKPVQSPLDSATQLSTASGQVVRFLTTAMLLAPSDSPLPVATPTSVASKTNDPSPPPQQSDPSQVDPNDQSGSSISQNSQDPPHPADYSSNQEGASGSTSQSVNGGTDPQTPYSFKVGQNNVQVSPSGVQINDKPVMAGSPPVQIGGDSQAWVTQDGSSLYIGSEVYNIAPSTLANQPTSPIQTVLPNGVSAAILFTGASPDSLDYPSSSGGKSDSHPGGKGSSLLSIYGTTLTPGSPAVTISSAQGYTTPLTLLLDTSNNLIYNPTSYALHPGPSTAQSTPFPLTSPLTTSISNLAGSGNLPVIVLPSDQGISLAGTTLYPSALLATANGALRTSGHDQMVIDGTTVSLQGASFLVLGGTRTVNLAQAAPPTNTAGGSPAAPPAMTADRTSSLDAVRGSNATGGTNASIAVGFMSESVGRLRELDRAFHVYSAIIGILGAAIVVYSRF